MRRYALIAIVVAGCASQKEARPLTGERKLDRCLAELQVTTCSVGLVPVANPSAPVKARATAKVASAQPAETHSVSIGVYDPEAGEISHGDDKGNLLVPVGGAIVSLAGGGGAVAYWFIEKGKGSGRPEVEVGGPNGTPVSVPTSAGADPGATNLVVKTAKGDVAGTTVFATDDVVAGTAPLTPEMSGPATITATQGGQVVGTTEVLIVSNSIQFVPQTILKGSTGTLVGQFLPADRNIVATIHLNCETTPNLVAAGTVTGSAGQWTVVFRGLASMLSGTPLLNVTATTDTPVQASASVEEAKP